MRGGVTDAGQTTKRTVKIELLSQWKLEAEFRNKQSINATKQTKNLSRPAQCERGNPRKLRYTNSPCNKQTINATNKQRNNSEQLREFVS